MVSFLGVYGTVAVWSAPKVMSADSLRLIPHPRCDSHFYLPEYISSSSAYVGMVNGSLSCRNVTDIDHNQDFGLFPVLDIPKRTEF